MWKEKRHKEKSMDPNDPKHDVMKAALQDVLESMGRAARAGKAQRFVKKPIKGVEVTMGDVSLEPHKEGDMEMGDKTNPPSPAGDMGHEGMTSQELEELLSGIQR